MTNVTGRLRVTCFSVDGIHWETYDKLTDCLAHKAPPNIKHSLKEYIINVGFSKG